MTTRKMPPFNVDKDIDLPAWVPDNGSLPWRLNQLEVDDSVAEVKRIRKEDMMFFDRKAEFESISGPLSSAVTRVQQRTDKKYRVERGTFLTTNSDVMLVVTATRVE